MPLDVLGKLKRLKHIFSQLLFLTLKYQSIANFGSNAPSVAGCEMRALQYYWWFMICTAFSGQLLAQMAINAWNTGLELGNQLTDFLRNIAAAIPSNLSVSWLNWVIYRFTITLPLFYLLQINAFLFGTLGLAWLARLQLGACVSIDKTMRTVDSYHSQSSMIKQVEVLEDQYPTAYM